jgi:hypothetical protein
MYLVELLYHNEHDHNVGIYSTLDRAHLAGKAETVARNNKRYNYYISEFDVDQIDPEKLDLFATFEPKQFAVFN